MRLFAHDPALIEIGADYLRIAGWSYLLTGVSQCYLAIMKVSEHASRTAWISSTTVVLNIVLNAILIFGLLGAPAMGVRGAALATLIARVVELVWAIASSCQKTYIRLRLSDIVSFNWGVCRDFWRCSLPILGAYLFWGVGFTSYTAGLGHMGADAAAANSVAAVVRDLMCCLCNGLSAAGGIVVGNELGAGRLERGKLYGDRLMVLSFVVGLLATVLVLLSIPPVLYYIKLTETARSYLVGMFVILSIYMIGRCVNTIVINGIFAAGGDTLFDFYSLAICMWGLAVPCAFIGAFWLNWHVLVVYACTCLDEVGKIPWVIWHFKRYKWVKNLTREEL
jgi:putative MATE family efflux protein